MRVSVKIQGGKPKALRLIDTVRGQPPTVSMPSMFRRDKETGQPRGEIRTDLCDIIIVQEAHRAGDFVLEQQNVSVRWRMIADSGSKFFFVLRDGLEGTHPAPLFMMKTGERQE